MRVHTSIAATANFAHPRHRGHRVPNQYSARHPDDLKTLGSRHDVVVATASAGSRCGGHGGALNRTAWYS